MAYYTPDIIEQIRQLDLQTYLQNYEPDEIVYHSRNTYTTREHDSLKISHGMRFWFSQGIGGTSALDYLIKVKDYSFTDAMEMLIDKLELPITYQFRNVRPIRDKLILPKKDKNNNKAKMYLLMRGIDKDIIDECISKELIYQDKNNNVVFVGYDNNIPKYAMCRGMKKDRFFKEAYGSDKSFSFRLEAEDKSNEVHIFESAIDLLSYATLLKMKGEKWDETNLLSLAGVYSPANDISKSKIPKALSDFLDKNKDTAKIYLHLDNDNAGRLSTLALTKALKQDYEVIDQPPNYGKDFNDKLVHEIKKKQRRKER